MLLENSVILPDDLDLSAFLAESGDEDVGGEFGKKQYEYMGVMLKF